MLKLCEHYNWQKSKLLTEERQDVMSDKEIQLKKRLVKLLKNDGRGHHHAKYAHRLEKYDINIVPIGEKPGTCAISFDEGIIYINAGFLQDPKIFYQLNVLMRHELCHDLLMHQVRMLKHITTIPGSRLKMSNSLHQILNIIEDFEISNRKYSQEDKAIVKNMWLNGKYISGLVTEDHRTNWLDLSIEKMYDALLQEIEAGNNTGYLSNNSSDTISAAVALAHGYKQNLTGPSEFDTKEEFYDYLKSIVKRSDPSMEFPTNWQEIFDGLTTIIDDPNTGYSEVDIEKMIKQVANSKAFEKADITSPQTGEVFVTVYTPEEKTLAIELLKIIGGNTAYPVDYKKWYDEIMRVVANDPDLTEDEIKELLDSVQ